MDLSSTSTDKSLKARASRVAAIAAMHADDVDKAGFGFEQPGDEPQVVAMPATSTKSFKAMGKPCIPDNLSIATPR